MRLSGLRQTRNKGTVREVGLGFQVGRELLIVAVFCGVYELLRTDVVQDGEAAALHSLWIVRLESQLGLFHESALQHLFLRVPDVLKAFNLYYGGTHFVVPAIALVYLFVRHRDRYVGARTVLAVTTAFAFLIFWLFPVAPPRLLPARFGIIDTLVTFHQSGHLEHSLIDSAGDIYAAMPSLHVAWALWCTLALYPVAHHLVARIALVAYPIVTALVVVTTGNHFFVDAIAGALLVALVWAAVQWQATCAGVHRPLDAQDERLTAAVLTGSPRHLPR